jgi:hypothetical protein
MFRIGLALDCAISDQDKGFTSAHYVLPSIQLRMTFSNQTLRTSKSTRQDKQQQYLELNIKSKLNVTKIN